MKGLADIMRTFRPGDTWQDFSSTTPQCPCVSTSEVNQMFETIEFGGGGKI
jgi:hypothetical protein